MELLLVQVLLGGHLLADFLLQSRWVATRKGRHPGALLLHGAVTYAVHLAVALPFLGRDLVLGLAGLVGIHLASDLVKARATRDRPFALSWFFGDQAVHVATVLGLAWWLSPPAPRFGLGGETLVLWGRTALLAGGFAFVARGGIAIVRGVLARFPTLVPNDETADPLAMGRVIGVLERFLTLILVLLGQWGALGLVVAAKSVARFRELEDKDFSDYYLIGTLASLLVAVGTGLALRALL